MPPGPRFVSEGCAAGSEALFHGPFARNETKWPDFAASLGKRRAAPPSIRSAPGRTRTISGLETMLSFSFIQAGGRSDRVAASAPASPPWPGESPAVRIPLPRPVRKALPSDRLACVMPQVAESRSMRLAPPKPAASAGSMSIPFATDVLGQVPELQRRLDACCDRLARQPPEAVEGDASPVRVLKTGPTAGGIVGDADLDGIVRLHPQEVEAVVAAGSDELAESAGLRSVHGVASDVEKCAGRELPYRQPIPT